MMDAAERDTQVRNFVSEVWNGRNYEAAADLYGGRYVNTFGTGPSARVEPIRRYHAAFPDLHLDVEELIVAGDTGRGQAHISRDRHRRVRGTTSNWADGRGVGGWHHALRG